MRIRIPAKNLRGKRREKKTESSHCSSIQNEDTIFVSLLKACAMNNDLDRGARVHAEIVEKDLLQKSPYVGNSLVNMYAKCGALSKAHQVLDDLPFPNTVSWNALISGYVNQGNYKEAITCFDQMEKDGISPDLVTFVCILKACSATQNFITGLHIHDAIVSRGLLGHDVTLENVLMDMYAKFGHLSRAQQVFNGLHFQNVVSWNTLLAAYAQQGHLEEAFRLFDLMQQNGFSPDVVTFKLMVKVYGSTGENDYCVRILDQIKRTGFLEKDEMLASAVVDMYVKCGALENAQKFINDLSIRNIVSWNMLIGGYVQNGKPKEALNVFERLRKNRIPPDRLTFISILKACGSIGAIDKGKEIHNELLHKGFLGKDIVLDTALVDMYGKFGMLLKAQLVFDELPIRNAVSWNVLIAGYIDHGQSSKALDCFDYMQNEGISPDAITFIYVLKACGNAAAVSKGQKIHELIINEGSLLKNVMLGTALVDMYARCGNFTKSEKVLNELHARNVITWNALITGYVEHRNAEEALNCFDRMQSEGHSPDSITFICMLRVFGTTGVVDKGMEIHNEVVRRELIVKDIKLANALVDMYIKCGSLVKARRVLNELPSRNLVSWNTMISGYSQQGESEEVLDCFEQMQREGVSPDVVTFTCILKACSSMGLIDKGKQIHQDVINKGYLAEDFMIGTTLVDMYAKCGALYKAQEVLDEIPFQNVVAWNILIAAYGQQGKGEEALRCFKKMQNSGLPPDEVTFLCILNACSHAGLVDEGEKYFQDFNTKYCINPDLDHYTCMVDLFGRAGHFHKAMAMIEKMPSCNYLAVWKSLLSACRKWGNVKLGRYAFDHAIQLDSSNSAVYMLMFNIYLAANMHQDAEKVELMRAENTAPNCAG